MGKSAQDLKIAGSEPLSRRPVAVANQPEQGSGRLEVRRGDAHSLGLSVRADPLSRLRKLSRRQRRAPAIVGSRGRCTAPGRAKVPGFQGSACPRMGHWSSCRSPERSPRIQGIMTALSIESRPSA